MWGGRRGRGGRRGESSGWGGRQCAVPPGELAGGAGEDGGAGEVGGGAKGGVEASWSQGALGWTGALHRAGGGGYGSAPILPSYCCVLKSDVRAGGETRTIRDPGLYGAVQRARHQGKLASHSAGVRPSVRPKLRIVFKKCHP